MTRIETVIGDITHETTDAIVNAANEQLTPGGGVCGAIHRAAGPQLAEACAAIGGCATGDAVITPGFELPARWVVHTVGPVWYGGDGDEDELLASCYRRSLEVAAEAGARSIAFPAISTGVFGYPLREATKVAISTLRTEADAHPIDLVRLVAFDEPTGELFDVVLAAS
ncbi:MAG: O-acetyl-ADP-ribose deacetylase [Ilumatobacteraceae bacterium]